MAGTNKRRSAIAVVVVLASLGCTLASSDQVEEQNVEAAVALSGGKNNSSGVTPFIIGGRDAALNQFPSIVYLQNDRYACGGTIIDRSWVLTAAHCVVGTRVDRTWVLAGTTDRNNAGNGGVYVWASELRIHGGYRTSSGSVINPHDIALIRLRQPLTFSNSVRPAYLLRQQVWGGEPAVVAGWGTTISGDSSSTSRTLKFADLSIVSRDQCNRAYGRTTISEDQICAAAPGRDSCQGDSGGPLYCNGWLVGVVSWGADCAHPAYPGVYSSVAAHLPWINHQTGLNL